MIRPQSPDPPPSLDELIRRLQRLRPCWIRPEAFFEERSDIVHHLRRIARNGLPQAPSRPAVERERRLLRLAQGLAKEVERLRRMVAEAARVRPRRRQQRRDSRQMALPF